MTRAAELRAMDLYRDFRGEEPEFVDTVDIPMYDVGIVVGNCIGIMYETTYAGKVERYIHKFKKKSQPVLVASDDGKQLYLLAGAYTFTDRGIVDN